uniref:Uncharacterized protein n=1 Tax=Anguilla anguilla TaxID=7936 RepID=A0A0E9UGP5_ANGAN
MSVEPNLLK